MRINETMAERILKGVLAKEFIRKLAIIKRDDETPTPDNPAPHAPRIVRLSSSSYVWR